MSERDFTRDSMFARRFGSANSAGVDPPVMPGSRQRVNLNVGYLTSFAHSASNTAIHVFQCAEAHRVAIGVPARRVLFIADEKSYELDFEPTLKRCASFSSVCEIAVLPQDANGLVNTANANFPLTDADILLQQASQLDFIRTIGALFRPTMSGGTPPIFELDEGQPLAPRIHCRRRQTPLRNAIVDGISKEALRVLTEEHARQVRQLQTQISQSRQFHTSETVDFFQDRDQLKAELTRLQHELHVVNRQLREERDASRAQVAQAMEDVRKARDEVTLMKLVRFQRPVESGPDQHLAAEIAATPPNVKGMSALQKLRDELSSNEQFIARLRSTAGSARRSGSPTAGDSRFVL